MATLPAFSDKELRQAKIYLATQVASMMGRKLEEGDWSKVYCQAKGIPEPAWSNLHIDVNHKGLGVEIKLLRISVLNGKPLKSVCGTTLMHPSATRAIRIDDTDLPAKDVMKNVFKQYAELIGQRTLRVQEKAPRVKPDMRTGWLIWEDTLSEFLYFEEQMVAPKSESYFAEWNETPARGVRKPGKSLWIYDKRTKQKRYSVTTSAGIKIQPYFDVPPPADENLYYFRVQGEPVGPDTIRLWIAGSTARALKAKLGSLDREVVSSAFLRALKRSTFDATVVVGEDDLAVPMAISLEAYSQLKNTWEIVSDEHGAQLLLKALSRRDGTS